MTPRDAETGKPLFVPLKAEYFNDFASGLKTVEYRLYGPRWNERVCRVGRPVVLSLGYGKRQRIAGTVTSFVAEPAMCLDGSTWRAIHALYAAEIDTFNAKSVQVGSRVRLAADDWHLAEEPADVR